MNHPEEKTLGQLVAELRPGQLWGARSALGALVAAVAIGGFWLGGVVTKNDSARQTREDAAARQAAVSEAETAKAETATWKARLEGAVAIANDARSRATVAEAGSANANALYNTCTSHNRAIDALEERLSKVDSDLYVAEINSTQHPEVAQGLREQQRILNEGLANCGGSPH